jgi:hypothetical protein
MLPKRAAGNATFTATLSAPTAKEMRSTKKFVRYVTEKWQI